MRERYYISGRKDFGNIVALPQLASPSSLTRTEFLIRCVYCDALLRLLTGGIDASVMKKKSRSRTKHATPTKSILRLPDLEHAKAAVLNSLSSLDAQRSYGHAIDEFVDWYCSEPRLALNRAVVLRYRSHLESRQLAPGTINLRLSIFNFRRLYPWSPTPCQFAHVRKTERYWHSSYSSGGRSGGRLEGREVSPS